MDDGKLILFALVLARVTGLTMTAPIYGGNSVPMQVRALLAVALALLLVPSQWDANIQHPGSVVYFVIQVGGEATIGACLGLGILILVHGMTLAGELVGQASGLTISDVFDPAFDHETPLFGRLLFMVTIFVFICLGGHRIVIGGLLDTFRAMPPGSERLPGSLAEGFVTLVSQSFALGIRAAAPAVTALLLATVVLGLVGRTLPQLNVLSLGFGLNAMLAFAVLGLTLGAAVWAFQDQVQPAMETILDALQTPANSEWLST